MTQLDQLLRHVHKTEACWLWVGATDEYGYGRVSRVTYGESLAHRAVYNRSGNFVAAGLHLCHKCDNPACVNPEHMFVGTQADNLADAKDKGRRLGEKPKKVTDEILVKIKEDLALNTKQREISRKYQISESYVSQIRHNLKRN